MSSNRLFRGVRFFTPLPARRPASLTQSDNRNAFLPSRIFTLECSLLTFEAFQRSNSFADVAQLLPATD